MQGEWAYFPGGKVDRGVRTDCLPSSSDKVKNESSYTSTLSIYIHNVGRDRCIFLHKKNMCLSENTSSSSGFTFPAFQTPVTALCILQGPEPIVLALYIGPLVLEEESTLGNEHPETEGNIIE